ncbi:MAG: glycosyltransferase [Epsilonproteobacteria bacterium]|nr:glycosyltransferase [Campylobacterota bacterium]
MAPRTVLMVTNNYFPYQGGVAQSVHASTQALLACGYNVKIVTLNIAGADQDPDYVHRLPTVLPMEFKNNPIAVPWRTHAYLKELIETVQPDIIHAHHPWLLGHAALKIARMRDCPVVFTHHTLYHAYTHYVPLPHKITSFLITQRLRTYYAQVDHIIAPSQAVAQAINTDQTETPISIVASPIRSCFFTPEKALSTTTQPRKLLYVGRFVREKNMPAMLEAVALLPHGSYELDAVGYGQLWHEIQTYAYDTLGLNPAHVRFHHKADQASLVAWYRQADLFLFPSSSDTQGLVLAEAMASGTPVIALDGPGQRSIINNGYNGYIVETVHEMAAAIERLTHDEQLLEKLSRGARTTANNYTLETHAQDLIAVYEMAIHTKKRLK